MTPRTPLLWLLAGLAIAGIAGAFFAALQPALLGAAIAVAVLSAGDAVACWLLPAPALHRTVAHTLSLGEWSPVRLALQSTRACTAEVFDHHPQGFATRDIPQTIALHAGGETTVSYQVKATERGDHVFALCQLRVISPLRLFRRHFRVPVQNDVCVYPNFSAVTKYALLGTDNTLGQTGIRRHRRRGEGLEFHQLREYRMGDSFRQIDWKATARMRKFISKEYQDERDQQIVFLLDTGRRMLTREGPHSHFDHVLNAMLLLSYVALRQGDSVGLYTMGNDRRWVPPRKGVAAINPLLRRIYDLQPSPVAVDYAGCATELAVRQKRRALVVLLTNVRDEDTDDLRAAIRLLRRRHLVLLASLRESELDANLVKPVHNMASALTYSATQNYLLARTASHRALSASGVFIHDAVCADLPAVITNRYLDIKRAGLL